MERDINTKVKMRAKQSNTVKSWDLLRQKKKNNTNE